MKLDLSKIDVVEFLNELGMMKVRKDGNEVNFSCPFGLHMKGGAISMQIGTTLCHCFGCGFKGNALTFLTELEDLSTSEAINWLEERWNVSRRIDVNNARNAILKRLDRSEKKRLTVIEPMDYNIPIVSISELENRELDWINAFLEWNQTHNSPYPLNYMLDRGFEPETLMDWHIGWDELAQAFTIPYHDEHGNLVGFKGRSLPGGDPKRKYVGIGNKEGKEDRYNFNTLDTSKIVFGLNKAEHNGELIICEGELNCIAMHQDGFKNTVGISGQYISDRQIQIIENHADRVLLIYDEWDRQVEIAERLRKFIPVRVSPQHDKDPADMTYCDKEELVFNSVSGLLVK